MATDDWFNLDDINFEFINPETGEYNQQLKQMLLPPPKMKKIPIDYAINLNEVLQNLQQSLVTEDEGVIKFLVSEGQDDTRKIEETSIVRVKCEQRNSDGTLVDKEANKENIYKIKLGGTIQPGLKLAFQTMKKGEKSWFKITGKYLYSDEEAQKQASVQEKYFLIWMVDFNTPEKKDPMNKQDRFDQIELFRKQGNKEFQNGNFQSALSKFKKGYNFVRWWPKKVELNEFETLQVKEYQILFTGNVSQSYIEQKNYQRAFQILDDMKNFMRCSKYEPKNYFRMAKCQLLMAEPELGIKLLNEGRSLCTLSIEEKECYQQLEDQCLKKNCEIELEIKKKMKK